MRFKLKDLAIEWECAPKVLRAIVLDADRFCQEEFEIELVVTRIREKIEGSSGVHEAGLAVDCRDEHGGKELFSEKQRKALLTYINGKYVRPDGKKTLISHKFKDGPRHWHFQCFASWAKHEKVF